MMIDPKFFAAIRINLITCQNIVFRKVLMNLTSMTTTRGNEQEVLRYAVIS
jgi:hypothetical protein